MFRNEAVDQARQVLWACVCTMFVHVCALVNAPSLFRCSYIKGGGGGGERFRGIKLQAASSTQLLFFSTAAF